MEAEVKKLIFVLTTEDKVWSEHREVRVPADTHPKAVADAMAHHVRDVWGDET
jgi:hypothetical protein